MNTHLNDPCDLPPRSLAGLLSGPSGQSRGPLHAPLRSALQRPPVRGCGARCGQSLQRFFTGCAILAVIMVSHGCGTSRDGPATPPRESEPEMPETIDRSAQFRGAMVSEQIAARGVRDQRVLEAMGSVPRHEFVPHSLQIERAHV